MLHSKITSLSLYSSTKIAQLQPYSMFCGVVWSLSPLFLCSVSMSEHIWLFCVHMHNLTLQLKPRYNTNINFNVWAAQSDSLKLLTDHTWTAECLHSPKVSKTSSPCRRKGLTIRVSCDRNKQNAKKIFKHWSGLSLRISIRNRIMGILVAYRQK